ncbi:MAG: efflux RND transporter periplasmic adaptor subunit [Flavobacteriaceae bacterium]|nr:efflux RND transporter periplasmic adaptor subunit [Flavobacteriaceae bacterium]
MKLIYKIGLGVLVVLVMLAVAYFVKTNSKSSIVYETDNPEITSIETKTVVTGKVIPQDEVEIKPQISGIIDELFVEEGDLVESGQLLARVKVVPNEQSLNSARGRVNNARIVLRNAEIDFNRNKDLFEKEIISRQEFENSELNFQRAQNDLNNASSDLRIIQLGTAGGYQSANTNIRSTITGTVLEIPIKEGDQVIESNTFNDGTTIATIADLNKMIFEGQVDESEVGKLEVGMDLSVSLGAIEDHSFDAILKFIAPKGTEEQGAVQFKIEGDVFLNDSLFVRAGYSANASLILERKDSILAISEALLLFDRETEQPYVEIQVGDQKFERQDVELGISDGLMVEILEGIEIEDDIKIWNKTETSKIGDQEDQESN